ncbi:MAG: amidohydrolase family protein [Candidatus Methanofastidiosia archaeon]
MIIKNGLVYTQGEFKYFDMFIGGGKILKLSERIGGEDIFDASGFVIVPGIKNTHMHASTILVRGIPSSGDLDRWVKNYLWKFEKSISSEEAYYGSLYCICQMLKSGITFFEDMHFREIEVLKACKEAGIRAVLSEALMDKNGWENPISDIGSAIKLAKKAENEKLIGTKMGIVSIRMSSEELIDSCVKKFKEDPSLFCGFHLHLNEVSHDVVFSKKKYGMLPTEFFYKKGLIDGDTTLAHCIHMEGKEVGIIAKRKATVSHCLGSNLRLASGIAPVKQMISQGVRITMGLDSPAVNDGVDIVSDARFAGLLHRLSPDEVAKMLFGYSGFGEGDPADIVMIEKNAFFPYKNFKSILAYGLNSGNVANVIIDGKFVLKNRKIVNLNEKRIEKKALKLSDKIWSRLESP